MQSSVAYAKQTITAVVSKQNPRLGRGVRSDIARSCLGFLCSPRRLAKARYQLFSALLAPLMHAFIASFNLWFEPSLVEILRRRPPVGHNLLRPGTVGPLDNSCPSNAAGRCVYHGRFREKFQINSFVVSKHRSETRLARAKVRGPSI